MAITMIDNRIYNDAWFYSLSLPAKWLFIFLITNASCNLLGCYEMPEQIICNYSGLKKADLITHLKELKERVSYVDSWVIINNYEKYNPMRNPNIEKSKQKQASFIPKRILQLRNPIDRVSIGLRNPLVTLQGNGNGIGIGNGEETETETEQETEIDENIPF